MAAGFLMFLCSYVLISYFLFLMFLFSYSLIFLFSYFLNLLPSNPHLPAFVEAEELCIEDGGVLALQLVLLGLQEVVACL